MMASALATPQAAEEAFYRAFERADLTEMMGVWAEDDGIVCVHPGGARHVGVADVRESWRRMFAQGPRLKFRLAGTRIHGGPTMSVHNLLEHVSLIGEPQPATPLLATNIYILTNRGWRLLLHHASPLAEDQLAPQKPPSILH
jgi:ketosteroid isomerase-like protein